MYSIYQYIYILSNGNKDEILPILYWIPKLHKNPQASWFIIASKNCSMKSFPKAVSYIFEHLNIFTSTYKIFIVNLNFFLMLQNILELQNVVPVIENINIINRKKKAKSIATYDFSTLHTTRPRHKLIKRLCNVIDFFFYG